MYYILFLNGGAIRCFLFLLDYVVSLFRAAHRVGTDQRALELWQCNARQRVLKKKTKNKNNNNINLCHREEDCPQAAV